MIEYTIRVKATVTKEYTVRVENEGMTHEEAEQRGIDYAAEIDEVSDNNPEDLVDNHTFEVVDYKNL